MRVKTESLSLDFWNRLLTRVKTEYEQKSAQLFEELGAVHVVQAASATLQLEHLATLRKGVVKKLSYLEQLRVLQVFLTTQLAEESVRVGTLAMENEIACMTSVLALYTRATEGAAPRTAMEQQLLQAESQVANHRPGSGPVDQLQRNRQRLQEMSTEFRLMGAEDAEAYSGVIRNLQVQIDRLEAEFHAQCVRHLLSIEVPDIIGSVLPVFGVPVTPVVAPAAAPEDGAEPHRAG